MQEARRHGAFVCVHQTNATVHSFAFQTEVLRRSPTCKRVRECERGVEAQSEKGSHSSNDGNPLGWLARRRIASGHGAEGDQTDIFGFGVPVPQGTRVVLMNQTKRW